MQNKTVVIDILQTSANGTSVFTESHSVNTSAQSLININIGDKQSLSGIDWSAMIISFKLLLMEL